MVQGPGRRGAEHGVDGLDGIFQRRRIRRAPFTEEEAAEIKKRAAGQ
jgi:hypothetical protein